MSVIIHSETFKVPKDDFNVAGEASGRMKRILRQLGVDAGIVRRIAVAAYEAEINLVIHAWGGDLSMQVSPTDVIIESKDPGPGIEDVEKALTAGYSTASESARSMGFGAGMGLPNMKRCADTFSIESKPGVGTKVRMGFNIS